MSIFVLELAFHTNIYCLTICQSFLIGRIRFCASSTKKTAAPGASATRSSKIISPKNGKAASGDELPFFYGFEVQIRLGQLLLTQKNHSPMRSAFEIPLRDLAPSAVEDWQARFPGGATVRVELPAASAPTTEKNEAFFWSIIGQLDFEKGPRAAVVEPAILALSRVSKAKIRLFHDFLNQKLFALDGLRFARELGSNRFSDSGEGHFSVDDFLYSRCGVVANGRDFFETVLANPARMPREFTFEPLLYLPERAWKLKTGKDDYDHFPTVSCETFSNSAGWPGKTPPRERLFEAPQR